MTATPAARLAMGSIRLYQRFLSPALGRNCRFSPTCSSYALEAVGRFGLIRGGAMALRRFGRCQPLVDGGYDPVPERI